MDESCEKHLIKGARDMGIILDQRQVKQFSIYYETLIKWNEKVNITRITEGKDIIVDHFLDSIGSAGMVEFTRGTSICDIGSGAGFPGIPLKIVFPRVNLTLIDSKRKSITFLNKLIRELHLKNVCAFNGRAEELAHEEEHREKYDVVLSRAVAPLQILVELCFPFVSQSGYFLAYKGKKVWEEVEEAEKGIGILGGTGCRVEQLKLPFSHKERYIVLIKKEGITPGKFPRRPGVPHKKPLD